LAEAVTVTRDPQQRSRVRRTAIVLALIAFAFYAGFIVMSVLQARS